MALDSIFSWVGAARRQRIWAAYVAAVLLLAIPWGGRISAMQGDDVSDDSTSLVSGPRSKAERPESSRHKIAPPASLERRSALPPACTIEMFGRSDQELPLLLVDAMRAVRTLPKTLVNVGPLTPDRVVVIDNMAKFFVCRGLDDPKLQERLRSRAAFCIRSEGRIFLNGERSDVYLAERYYENRALLSRTRHLPYRFASFLVHELGHLGGENGESGPTAAQYNTLLYFQAQGKFPPECQSEIDEIGQLAEDFRQKEFTQPKH